MYLEKIYDTDDPVKFQMLDEYIDRFIDIYWRNKIAHYILVGIYEQCRGSTLIKNNIIKHSRGFVHNNKPASILHFMADKIISDSPFSLPKTEYYKEYKYSRFQRNQNNELSIADLDHVTFFTQAIAYCVDNDWIKFVRANNQADGQINGLFLTKKGREFVEQQGKFKLEDFGSNRKYRWWLWRTEKLRKIKERKKALWEWFKRQSLFRKVIVYPIATIIIPGIIWTIIEYIIKYMLK